MTDQTPRTEAGRRAAEFPDMTTLDDVLAIEAEARASVYLEVGAIAELHEEAVAAIKADALREAAEQVRALSLRQGGTGIQTYRAEVLAILTETER